LEANTDLIEAEVNENTKGALTKIVLSSIALLIVGFLNSLWTKFDYHPWYDALTKPIISPASSALVGIIWSIMFITLGIAVGQIWQVKTSTSNEQLQQKINNSYRILATLLFVNMLVPSFFFWLNNLYLVLVGATINLLLMLLLAQRYYQIKKVSAYILIPFIIWLIYAVILDIAFVLIN